MIRDYFNSKANIWDDLIAETDTAKLKALANRLDIRTGSRILDVGTGTGIFVPYLLNKIGAQGELIALDIAEAMLGIFLSKGCYENVGIVQADIVTAPFISGYFDTVICYSVFPHFQDKLGALSEISRILRNDGVLYICHSRSRDEINNIHRSIPDVCYDLLPDGDNMGMLLKNAGFYHYSINDLPDSYFVSARKSVDK